MLYIDTPTNKRNGHEPGPVLVHRSDIQATLRALATARPDWSEPLQAVAIGLGVELVPDPLLVCPQ